MHQPPYPPSDPHQPQHQQHPQQHHPQQHLHQHPQSSGGMHPHQQHPYPAVSAYPGTQMQPLPSMPPPSVPYQDSMPMSGPGAPQPGPPSDVQSGSQSEGARPQLTPEQLEQQKQMLTPWSSEDGQGRKYTLYVVQQPQRARMCGFGDKDRRPITPPPCVKLVIRDTKTGKEVDCNEIEHSMYVLNVDLWSEDALKEVNLVRHTTASPSISSTSPASYAQIDSTPAYSQILPSNLPGRDVGYHQQIAYPPPNQYAMQSSYGAAGFVTSNSPYAQQPSPVYSQQPFYRDYQPDMSMYGPPRVYEQPGYAIPQQRMSIGGTPPSGMFTRNLIGSLAASAFRLQDTEDKIGIWFVLQDLSVRTEGCFRLRFSFVNVGGPMGSNGNGQVHQGKAPVLASVFSDVFQVYSAKKFPGVCESTALSKCFATQGIKIPIRKEGEKKGGAADDDDEY
ncbi:velvet factor-domain-containing protein [Podospora australis]|uniref:Velvet factor-domain-containing protein n=1 Tax=Podospora australis TaxID=1536484 RepID=A0AAN6X3X5_9PEZI|nr:velvet factor-domain-containing protein [Podospora australis]